MIDSTVSRVGNLRYDAEAFYSDYEPMDVLGRGISSVVRRCLNRESGHEFAVKIIDLLQEEAPTIEEVQNEIDLLHELAGAPDVIHIFDVYQTETYVFLVFELMKCELFEHLNSVIRLREHDAKAAVRQLFIAVSELHRRDIIHRDIKLENVLIDDNLNVKLTDFGFAIKASRTERLRPLCGTPAYMAPEMLRCACDAKSEGYSFPADIWSCGVLLATLLSGSAPFYHRRELMMLRMIMDARYSLSGPEWRDISKNAKDLVGRILCLDQSKRITAKEALEHQWFREGPCDTAHPSTDCRDDVELKKCCLVTSELAKIGEDKIIRRKRALVRFRAAVLAVIAIQFLKVRPLSIENATKAPYSTRQLRVLIDSSAFGVYGHWVKRNTNQDRTALFQHNLHSMSSDVSHGAAELTANHNKA